MLQAHTDIPVQEEYQLALYVTIDAHKILQAQKPFGKKLEDRIAKK